jgi:hypothetical protein
MSWDVAKEARFAESALSRSECVLFSLYLLQLSREYHSMPFAFPLQRCCLRNSGALYYRHFTAAFDLMSCSSTFSRPFRLS